MMPTTKTRSVSVCTAVKKRADLERTAVDVLKKLPKAEAEKLLKRFAPK